MTVELIEFLLGLYFIGIAVSLSRLVNISGTLTVEWFKLILGIVLLVLALMHGVRF